MNEHAVDLLYEYTFILLSGISEDIGEDILNRITSIEEQVEKLIQNNRAWDKNKWLGICCFMQCIIAENRSMNFNG